MIILYYCINGLNWEERETIKLLKSKPLTTYAVRGK